MEVIKSLPEPVRNSVRAGIVLFDVTRVVEELVYNSLDAGASKISIFVALGTSYVKVVDDGSGITRDGLVLLGERYVTSKFHDLVDMDAKHKSFGFRGEALASISDVSLVEIITKAYGRANGYRKVMKSSKCLYIGIDDDREDVGTTVVVRDLFYNQPVRRKYMQSSESNLLCTCPCSSPLSLLRSGFGREISSSLHGLEIGDGNLKLSGYICSPFDSFNIKAVQYIYINKRFICKGQIHKLLNQLASRFVCMDVETSHGSQSRKRSRSQVNPAYILNLECPRSLYDLTLESSKTFVQYKDWTPILTFIEETIQQFWTEKFTRVTEDQMWKNGDNMMSKKSENAQPVKESRMQNHQVSHTNLFSPSQMLTRDDDDLFPRELHDKDPCVNLHTTSIDLNAPQINMESSHQAERFLKAWDSSLAKCSTAAVQNSDKNPLAPDKYFVSEDLSLDGGLIAAERCGAVENNIFSTVWKEESPKMHINLIKRSAGSTPFSDFHEVSYDDNVFTGTKPFLRSCLSGRSFPLETTLSPCGELTIENCVNKRIPLDGHDSNIQGSYYSAGTSWQDKRSCSLTLPEEKSLGIYENEDFLSNDKGSCSLTLSKEKILGIYQNEDFLSNDFFESVADFGDQFSKEKLSFSGLDKQEQNLFSSYQTISSPCSSLISSYQTISSPYLSLISSPIVATDWKLDHFIVKDVLERNWKSGERTPFRDLVGSEEKGCGFNNDIMLEKENTETCIFSCKSNNLIVDGFFDTNQALDTFLEKTNQFKQFSPESPDMHSSPKGCFNWRLLRRDYEEAYGSPKHQFGDQGFRQSHLSIERSRRSLSAPPNYKRKTIFCALGSRKAERVNAPGFHDTQPHLDLVDLGQHSGSSNLPVSDLLMGIRTDTKKMPSITGNTKEKRIGEISKQSQLFDDKVTAPLELRSKETQDSSDLWIKWQNCCPLTTKNEDSLAVDDQISILDISSGFLSLAGCSLVPESIDKNFLENAKVLLQLDKKFIPVISGGTLAVIDQHAADERIRLEDLRQKLLSGEEKTIAYLDTKHELMLPEIGYQLLHNYADQVKEWGWICNIHAQDSKSFQRNLNILHKKETVITLIAVPCILGVKLSDLDLLEFLHQLADTDGSSTMPPSVLRVLNSKACRGAIMFGDSLLPSECSLIVEELKQTTLCFQCAHGRPTTVPLVNLEALHKQIRELGLSESCHSDGAWHGLRPHEISIERALQRLNSAKCS